MGQMIQERSCILHDNRPLPSKFSKWFELDRQLLMQVIELFKVLWMEDQMKMLIELMIERNQSSPMADAGPDPCHTVY